MSTIDELEKIFANVNYWLDYAERKNMSLFAFFSVFSVVAASAANYFIILMFMILLGYRFDWKDQLSELLLPMVVFNAVFAFPVHFWTRRLFERFDAKS